MKRRCDYPSYSCNLRNCKFYAEKISGLQRDSNTETRILGADQFTEFIFEFMGSNPVEAQM